MFFKVIWCDAFVLLFICDSLFWSTVVFIAFETVKFFMERIMHIMGGIFVYPPQQAGTSDPGETVRGDDSAWLGVGLLSVY